VEDGVLKRFALQARSRPAERFVLIVDELNRANLPKVFGELFFLLEYRQRTVTLPYSQGPFSLPENLYIIGTMNTADRSIALVDFALRRRFGFIPFRGGNMEELRAYLARHRPKLGFLADMLVTLNREIDDDDYEIGHSHFMPRDPGRLDEAYAERVWKYSVEPHLHEFWYENRARASDFSFERLKALVLNGDAPVASEPEAAEPE
jgi:5-methylcytosine-specific restriction enzyme B